MNHYFSFDLVMVRIGGITGEQTLNIYPLRGLSIDQVQKQEFIQSSAAIPAQV
ncbi:hypothetical protein [Photorhabdus antumapuensis]|uniref:hypothetical protein n=1 Tax=Photorhabdus antumapuensis TaxID=2862867 RepID=UPI001CEC418A|nr:hypothetical protein [Photorhabdus antumapuensis]MCA6220014.1 hypothetical protein [Photorhabdus antumapuensis]